MSTWLDRLHPSISTSSSVVCHARLEYGVSQLLHSLDIPERQLIWLEVTAADNDIALGNKLAARVNQVFQAQLLSSFGLHYNFDILQTLLPHIGPITLALTRAELAPEAAQLFLSRSVLNSSDHTYRAVIQTETSAGLELPESTVVLTTDDLKLRQEEALELAGNRVSRGDVYKLLTESQGAYDKFLFLLAKKLELSVHLSPGPQGPRILFDTLPVKPAALLNVLMRQKRWIEALELAVEVLPEQVITVLEKACHCYHENGLHERLLHLLDKLSPDLKAHELVRYWRLQAAFRLGREGEQRREVEAYLQEHEAPALRALAAGVFVPTNRKEALRAYKVEKTPFTAFMLGRLTYGKQGIALLKESITLAEKQGEPYEIVRNAGALAEKLIARGDYHEAAEWGDWAVTEFKRLGVQDGQLYLQLVNQWAYARILTGNVAGLEPILSQNEKQLSKTYPDLAGLFRSTLGDYFLVASQPSQALIYYLKHYESSPRYLKGFAVVNLVRAYLDIGKNQEAFAVAQATLKMLENESAIYQLPALLASGMAMALIEPLVAREHLLKAQYLLKSQHFAIYEARTSLYLALTYLHAEPTRAKTILERSKKALRVDPTFGLRLLSGPDHIFQPIWAMLSKTNKSQLELKVLGKNEVWYQGEKLKLFPSLLELLTVLAIEQRPLFLEEFTGLVYGEHGKKTTLKANLAKMRRILPISQHPYCITVPYKADVLDISTHLRNGNLLEAVTLYGGALLKFSNAPSIRAKQEEISEALCQYALTTGDIEVLMRLSELIPDDLRLLDKLFYTLDKHDPRASYVKARVEQLRNSWLDVPLRRKKSSKVRSR